MKKLLAIWVLVTLLSPVFAFATTVSVSEPAPYGRFGTYALFWTFSVIVTMFCIWAFWKARYTFTTLTILALAAAILALSAVFASATLISMFFSLIVALVVVLLATFVDENNEKKKIFFVLSGGYGTCMAASMVGFILS